MPARQSYRLTDALQTRLTRAIRDNSLSELPPILTFQSVVDFTVSARAVVNALYARLPANGSELVLFDLNRDAAFEGLLSPAVETVLERLTPPAPRAFKVTVVANADPDRADVVARATEPGVAADELTRALGLDFPPGVYSLSHIALPFPVSDGLYGLDPDPRDDFGIHLGALAARGERGTLIMSLDSLLRISSNPFFPFVEERLREVTRQADERALESSLSGHIVRASPCPVGAMTLEHAAKKWKPVFRGKHAISLG
jgi:hypothetical protein